jgi:lipopolysaccharide transport system ATP-binding protein
MMNTPIRLDGISKCYRIYDNPQARFKQALRDRLFGIWGRADAVPLYREHWALKEISFELHAGEAIGIVGRNGAGKSTLLQIIAGTLEPTSGSCETNGRITALLELGSGFNPEFTGRENVILNAMILGLTREAAFERFDAIASFADIGDFIDQPVKTYSSGMMMRLAFSVQTAVDPQILIVDEALSVGDMFFQAKCMARINKLVDNGVALLFVSHDAASVRQLCERAVLLDRGKLAGIGPAGSIVDQYVKLQLEDRNREAAKSKSASMPVWQDTAENSAEIANRLEPDATWGREVFKQKAEHHRAGNGTAVFVNVQMLRKGSHAVEFAFDDEVEIRCYALFRSCLENCNLSLKIRTLQGMDVLFFDTRLQNEMDRKYLAGRTYRFSWIFRLPLLHGSYSLSCGIAHPPIDAGQDWVFADIVQHAYDFRMAPRREGMIDGLVILPASLDIREVEDVEGLSFEN